MKITNLETISLSIPLRHRPPAGSPGWERRALPMLLVQIDTDEGVSGWGEAWSLTLKDATRAAIDHVIAPICIGHDATRISDLTAEIRWRAGSAKPGPLTYGLSAVDIALWDILGKTAGLPLYRLLGGSAKGRIEAYASLIRYGESEAAAAKAAEVVDRGYRHLKLHEDDVAPIRAVREAVGEDVTIRLDPAWAWTPVQAIEMAQRLKDCGLVWLEEPIWPPEDYRGLAAVGARGGLPLAAGENAVSAMDFRNLLELAGIAYAQPSVVKIGGLTELRKVMALAELFNTAFAPHSYYLGPGLLATLHAIAAASGDIVVEHACLDMEAAPYGNALALIDGCLMVPQASGLGIDPDPAVLSDYRE